MELRGLEPYRNFVERLFEKTKTWCWSRGTGPANGPYRPEGLEEGEMDVG